jgi:hypothetical protein
LGGDMFEGFLVGGTGGSAPACCVARVFLRTCGVRKMCVRAFCAYVRACALHRSCPVPDPPSPSPLPPPLPQVPFNQKPDMKAAEIMEAGKEALRRRVFFGGGVIWAGACTVRSGGRGVEGAGRPARARLEDRSA